MSHQIKINADLIENILLCDPVTFRGKEKLKALGLEEKIGPKEFFDPQNGLWVEPIDEAKTTDMFTFDSLDPSPYGAKKVKYDDIEDRRTEFNRRLSGTPGSYFIALMGVVGSGKSIEIQRRIFENYGEKFLPYRHDEYDGRNNILPATPDAILVDLERNVKHVTYSSTYTCPNADSPLWLFCTALLDTLFYYICFLHREHRAKLMHIENNLTYYFIREDKYTVKVDAHVADLFSAISKWARGHSEASLQDIFDKILSLLISKPTDYSDRGSFQATLQKIWNAGWTKSVDGEEYEWRCFGVRLGEAGKAFLIEWQPSFSFFAALYCNNQPPLFFVKNKEMIISILNKVCDYGRKVMYAYRREASAYLKKREPEKINHDEFTDKNQLAEKEESSQTYRQQIRDAHKRYLFLYKDYIDKCGSDLGLLDTEKTDIIHEIDSLINSYDALEWKEKAEIERIENENDREEAMRNLWPCF